MTASSVTPELLNSLTSAPPQQAWEDVGKFLWTTFSQPLPTSGRIDSEILNRDRGIAELENLLAGSCWDLWSHFESSVPKGSQAVIEFWNRMTAGKAVLILDGLSLREIPWLLSEATSRGFTLHEQKLYASELPCETTPYAKALGLQQRSQLANNMASSTHHLLGAHTESNDLPWVDSSACVGSQENFAYWHHWPDHRIHDLAKPGEGLKKTCDRSQKSFDFRRILGVRAAIGQRTSPSYHFRSRIRRLRQLSRLGEGAGQLYERVIQKCPFSINFW